MTEKSLKDMTFAELKAKQRKETEAKINEYKSLIAAGKKTNPKYCKSCNFAHGDTPDSQNPDNPCCIVYEEVVKPYNVLFDGAECPHYNDMDREIFLRMKARADDNAHAFLGAIRPTAKYCQTCLFAHGDTIDSDEPDKAHCMVFVSPDSKPKGVLFDGAKCPAYVKK